MFDTHILVWALSRPMKVPGRAQLMLQDPLTVPLFSAVSVWEVAIKASNKNRPDFDIDPMLFHEGLKSAGYEELPVKADQSLLVQHLPFFHGDPFDRLMVAQAQAEGIVFVTADRALRYYGSTVMLV